MFIGKDDEALCDIMLHEFYRSVLGVVVWTVLTRAELAVYVQALHRRAHAVRTKDCRGLNFAIRDMKRPKCGFTQIVLQHPLKLVGFTDAAFKAQPAEPTGFALGGLLLSYKKTVLPTTNQCHPVVGQI